MTKTFDVIKLSPGMSVVVDKEATIGVGDKVYSFDCVKTVNELFTALQTSAGDNIPSVRYKEVDISHQWAEVAYISKIVATIGEKLEGIPIIEIPEESSDCVKATIQASKDNGGITFEQSKWFMKGYLAASKKWADEDFLRYIDIRMKLWKESIKKREFKDEKDPFAASEKAMHERTIAEMNKSFSPTSLQKKEIKSVELEYVEDPDYANQGFKDIKLESYPKITHSDTDTIIPVKINYKKLK